MAQNKQIADLLRENRQVKIKIRSVEDKIIQREANLKRKKQEQAFQETFYYRMLMSFSFLMP